MGTKFIDRGDEILEFTPGTGPGTGMVVRKKKKTPPPSLVPERRHVAKVIGQKPLFVLKTVNGRKVFDTE